MIISSPSGSPRKSTGVRLNQVLCLLTICGGLGLLSGCLLGGGPTGTVRVLEETPSPSEIVVEAGMSPPAASVIEVRTPPPEPKTETAPKRPGPNYAWLAGNWRYYDGRFVWVSGRWALPPRPHAVYKPPHWSVRNGNHMFTEGYWHF